MGFFNLIESLFLLSLGITFILILLLVWHFKTRLGSIEQKNDTMFEIINNVVKEINVLRVGEIGQLKNIIQATLYSQNAFQPNPEIYSQTSNKLSEAILTNVGLPPIQEEQSRILNDADDDDDSVSEYDEDDEYSGSEETSNESASEIENTAEEPESEEASSIPLSNEEVANVEIIEQIKVVHLPTVDYENIEDIQDLVEETVDEFGQSEMEELGDVTELINVTENEQIVVSKLEETNSVQEKEEENTKESVKEPYKKLSIQQLKALVISRGLATDVAKMKKAELVKLLENAEI